MMAPTDLVDLDKLDPLPVNVRIAGETFKVPGAAPLSWLWRFRQLEEQLSDESTELDFIEAVRDMVADLIALEQPTRRKAAVDALSRKSPATVLGAIRAIYAGHAEEDDAVPPPSTTTKNGSSPSRAAKPATRKRSRSSSSSGR